VKTESARLNIASEYGYTNDGMLGERGTISVSRSIGIWNGYARVFGYDEEGRLVRIERDYGNGSLQLAYAYGYNSDGVRVWKQDVLAGQEYRYVCRIGCGGVPMRVYNRAMGEQSWNTLEEYVETPTVRWYGTSAACGQDYEWLSGHWLSGCAPPPEGTMLYQDAFGLRVGGDIGTAAVPKRVPEYLLSDDLGDLLKRIGDLVPKNYKDCVRKCKRLIPAPIRPRGFCEWLCARFFDPTPPQPKPQPQPPQPSPPPSPAPPPKDCPPGTCKFVCPGKDPAKEFGCAPPGTPIKCPDGTEFTLPSDCEKKQTPVSLEESHNG